MADRDRELLVLEKSKELVKLVYGICRLLPKEERYTIISQISRAVISIPSNIAEGNQRGKKEFIHYLNIARGSLAEVKVLLEIIEDVYSDEVEDLCEIIYDKIDEIGKMTYGLILNLKSEI